MTLNLQLRGLLKGRRGLNESGSTCDLRDETRRTFDLELAVVGPKDPKGPKGRPGFNRPEAGVQNQMAKAKGA